MPASEPGPSGRTDHRMSSTSLAHNRPAQILAAVSAVAIIAAVWGWSAAGNRGKERDDARQRAVTVEQSLTTAKLDNEKLTVDLAKARTENDTAKQSFTDLGSNLQRATTQIQELTKQRDTLIQERDRFQQQFSELQGRVGERASIQADLDQARQRAADLQTQIQQSEQRLQQLQAGLPDAERQLAQAQEALAAAQRKAQETTDRVTAGERRLAEIQSEVTQASQNLGQITAEIADQTKVLSETRDNTAAAAQQIAQMNQEIARLQAERSNLQPASPVTGSSQEPAPQTSGGQSDTTGQ